MPPKFKKVTTSFSQYQQRIEEAGNRGFLRQSKGPERQHRLLHRCEFKLAVLGGDDARIVDGNIRHTIRESVSSGAFIAAVESEHISQRYDRKHCFHMAVDS